jgi:uncharacterized protein (TIGR02452 family)
VSATLRAIAQENERFIAEGHYVHPTVGRVDIGTAVRAAVGATRSHQLDELTTLLGQPVAGGRATRFEVTGESSIAAALRCHHDGGGVVGVLDYASARSVGGGYLNGAKAQEEDLCRCSALHACLLRAPEYYAAHRASTDLRYSHRVISAPGVPVFRDDRYRLLPAPVPITFVVSAAPNTGQLAQRAPELLPEIPALLTERAQRVLAVAVQSGVDDLVLGAWGCGVFGNSPSDVARAFATCLGPGGRFADAFDRVVFAVYDRSRDQATLGAFHTVFG